MVEAAKMPTQTGPGECMYQKADLGIDFQYPDVFGHGFGQSTKTRSSDCAWFFLLS